MTFVEQDEDDHTMDRIREWYSRNEWRQTIVNKMQRPMPSQESKIEANDVDQPTSSQSWPAWHLMMILNSSWEQTVDVSIILRTDTVKQTQLDTIYNEKRTIKTATQPQNPACQAFCERREWVCREGAKPVDMATRLEYSSWRALLCQL